MEYRLLLIQNADKIIANNQAAAVGNCSDISPLLNKTPIGQTPHLLASITDNPLPEDYSSDMKNAFLQNYTMITQLSTPEIRPF